MTSGLSAPSRSVRRRSFDVGRLARGRRRGGILARVWTVWPARLWDGNLTGRPEGKRFAFHTRPMGTARPGASALAGQHLPQHVATVPIRLMFNAKHTRSHSPRTFAKPRRLNRAESEHLLDPPRSAPPRATCVARTGLCPRGSPVSHAMRRVAGSRAGCDRHLGLASSRPSARARRCRDLPAPTDPSSLQ